MWKVTAQSETDAEILLYDMISDTDSENWGIINAKGLISKVKALGNVQNITLRINSVGGDVFEAQAMYSYLKSHPANITVRVDGLAASAASVVAMAGDKVIMPTNALMMIHNPSGGVWGEAEDMRDTAEILDKIRDTIANVYMARTGLDREKVVSMMDSETWLTATEAHELKFCDEVEESVTVTAMAVKGGTIFSSGFGFARIDENLSAKLPANTVMIRPANKATNQQEGEKTEMGTEIKNAADLESAYPEIVGEIRASAVNAERERLKTLDSLNAPGREAIIARAKYEDPKDARDIAIDILRSDTAQAQLGALHQDAQAVNGALPPQKSPGNDDEDTRIISMIAQNVNTIRGVK